MPHPSISAACRVAQPATLQAKIHCTRLTCAAANRHPGTLLSGHGQDGYGYRSERVSLVELRAEVSSMTAIGG